MPLVLSIFPGIDLLGRAFEESGFCVVRGPDLLWGGDIHSFHPPPGKFDGVIGGPPCQFASRLRFLNPKVGLKHGNLIPEFERVVAEAQPRWWLMENVPEAPEPVVADYIAHHYILNNRWFGAEQHRKRRFSFGSVDGQRLIVEVALFEAPLIEKAVLSQSNATPVILERDGKGGHRLKRALRPPTVLANDPAPGQRDKGNQYRTIGDMCVLQGLSSNFLQDDTPFTAKGKRAVIGNGVPMPMGRAVARAVKRAVYGG